MTKTEVNNKISYYEGLINSSTDKVNELANYISSAEEFYAKMNEYIANVEMDKDNRVNRVNSLGSKGLQVKLVSIYCDGMQSLLTGSAFSTKYDNLTSSRDEIYVKLENMREDKQYYEGLVNQYSSDRDYWVRQLQYAEDDN